MTYLCLMPVFLEIEQFIDKLEKEKTLLLDVRSEKEFDHARIPGAINLPVLNNEHRHLVGVKFKKKGREAAVILGFELVGPDFHNFILKTNELTDIKVVMVYCWRGGMRSTIMTWILEMAGYRVFVLKGGYKSFRNFILDRLKLSRKVIVLGGHTGCGKTEILKEMNKTGQQMIDLEELANHRGSAFGSLGLGSQPSNEFFENKLGILWNRIDETKFIWIEAESHTIGKVKIPDSVFEQLKNAPFVEVVCSREYRMQRILKEYGGFLKTDLADCTSNLSKRLGNLRLTEALSALSDDRMFDWLTILMDYYDKTYTHSTNARNLTKLISVRINEGQDPAVTARLILEEVLKSNNFIAA